MTRLLLPYAPGVPTLSVPDGTLTRDDEHALLVGHRAWAPTERIRCRFTAEDPRAWFQAGYSFRHLSLRSDDVAAGFLIDATDDLDVGDTLVRAAARVTAFDQGGGTQTMPRGLWWLERHLSDVVVRFGSKTAHPVPNTDYRVIVSVTSSGGAVWDTQLPLLSCRT